MCLCFPFSKLGCGKSSCVAFKPHAKAKEQDQDMASGGSNTPVPEFPASESPQRVNTTSTGRGKVALKPGHSLIDWIKLGKSGKDLTGVGGQFLDVTAEELAKHNTREDAWTCLKGTVYNITPYMDFHPGGPDELIKAAGIDGTDLFNEIHKWVNADSMLEHCVVGRMMVVTTRRDSLMAMPSGKILLPPLKPQINAPTTLSVPDFKQSPKHDWFQSDDNITLIVYTKWKDIRPESIIIDNKEYELNVSVIIENYALDLQWELEDLITSDYEVKVGGGETGKVEIILTKAKKKHWKKFKKVKEDYTKITLKDVVYRKCRLMSKESVTHDTYLLGFELPKNSWMKVPIGYHVYIRMDIKGLELVRPYTIVLSSFKKDKQDPRFQSGQVMYLMIKFYSDGNLTSQLSHFKVGDFVDLSDYEGSFKESRLKECIDLVLLAAGTGFTPMVRLICSALEDRQNDKRSVKLMFFNKKEQDILWRKELDQLVQEYEQFEVIYVLSEPNSNWSGPTGRVSKQHLDGFVPLGSSEDEELLVCVCGPTLFTELTLKLLGEIGCPQASIHAFT